jgi:hypothetical protein
MILERGNDEELRDSLLYGADKTVLRWLNLILHGDAFLKLSAFRRVDEKPNEITVRLLSSTDCFRTWMHVGSLVLWYGVPCCTVFEVTGTDGDRSWYYDPRPPLRPVREHDIIWMEIDRLLPDAPACETCKLRSYLVTKAPVMTAYSNGPQPQPLLCPECTEDWVYSWDERWAEYNASRG